MSIIAAPFHGTFTPSSISGGGGVPGVASTIFFVDGVEHYSTAITKWTDTASGSQPSIASGASGAHGRYFDNTSFNEFLPLGSNLTHFAIGCRFQARADASQNILLMRDGTTAQVSLQYVAGGSMAILRNVTSLDSTAAGLITLNAFYYLMLAGTIDNASGSLTAKIYDDSKTLLDTLTFSGDTQNTANSFVNQAVVGGASCDALTDDIWIANTNALYVPLRVETLYPQGNGSLNEWTRAGADSGANWSQVDEAQANGTTDYVQSAFNGKKELYDYPTRSLTGAIHGVQVTPVITRSGAVGGMTFRAIVKISGTTYTGTTLSLTNGFIAQPYCWGTSPATGIGWTESELNAAEFGVERVAGTETTVFDQLTQCVVEVIAAA